MKELIAERAAALLQPGWVVNLGIGIPTLLPKYIDPAIVCLQTENGLLGVGPPPAAGSVDPNLIDAGKRPVTQAMGSVFFDSATSFAMIRGGHVHASVLGALQVDAKGRIANWAVPGEPVLGVGGAMDLLAGAKTVIVLMSHSTKDGTPKIVRECTLPITSLRPADWVVTELATFRVNSAGLMLVDIAPESDLSTLRAKTEADFSVALSAAAGTS